jgi:hypothetical protein
MYEPVARQMFEYVTKQEQAEAKRLARGLRKKRKNDFQADNSERDQQTPSLD